MAKVSEWKVIATEGPTVDGRKITREWIEQMAANYDQSEYTALIWPEHRRFYGYGENWGKVTELKTEERDGKMRLYAKLQPNDFLLEANRRKQKLFTSIEPNPDYKGEGRCYLMGLAVTDSPASTGTSELHFSRSQGEVIQLEASQLEELDLSDCYTMGDRLAAFFNELLHSGDSSPEPENNPPQPEEEEPMNQEQFSQVMGAINSIGTKQGELEEKFNQFSQEPPAKDEGTSTENDEDNGNDVTSEQFSQLTNLLESISQKQGDLETQFGELKKEVPNQEPNPEGGVSDKFSQKDVF